jgi:hypothetical protein
MTMDSIKSETPQLPIFQTLRLAFALIKTKVATGRLLTKTGGPREGHQCKAMMATHKSAQGRMLL